MLTLHLGKFVTQIFGVDSIEVRPENSKIQSLTQSVEIIRRHV